jgi:hypothetical protein
MACALLPNIKSGGEAFQPPSPLPISFTSLLPLYHWQHASLSASKPQRKVQFGTQLYTPMAFSSFCPENGGRRLMVKAGEAGGQYSTHRNLSESCADNAGMRTTGDRV